MSDLASMRDRLAASERRIVELEAQKRQYDIELEVVRVQSQQRARALRDLVARLCPVVSVLDGIPFGREVFC